jgi:hypothetical protein
MNLHNENPQAAAPPPRLLRTCLLWRLASVLYGCLALSGCGALTPSLPAHTSGSPAPTPSPSYEVELSWDIPDSSSDPIVGYNVYRSATGASQYQVLNGTLDPDPSWIDTTVKSGTVYDYIVTSVDKSGLESSPSNTVNLTIP